MEEVDADELVWMACQPMPEEEYVEDFPFDEDEEDSRQQSYPRLPEVTNTTSASDNESGRKRVLSDFNLPSSSEVQGAAKRMRDSHREPIKQERMWTPPSSPISNSEPNLDTNVVQRSDIPAETATRRPPDQFAFRVVSDIEGDYMPITGVDGDRVYAKLSQTESSGTTLPASNCRAAYVPIAKGLLAKPIGEMLDQAEAERMQKMFCDEPLGDSLGEMAGNLGAANDQLWVDKYSPKAFTDLLSDEQTNRQVLHWLKQWDSAVFGVKNSSFTTEDVLVALRRKRATAEARGFGTSYRQDHFGAMKSLKDGNFTNRSTSWTLKEGTKYNPQEGPKLHGLGSQTVSENHEKVLLLCGPPGLGKTTLAHIAAKHCGYRIVEINASDDRVAATLQGKILDAVEMKSVTGDHRPNCLIIDEIDGAIGGSDGRSAIKHLVDIITASKKTSASSQDDASKRVAKKKNAASSHGLSRPIICICNDLYAPALRPLRQVARVHVFSRPSAGRVVSRLKDICKEEGYTANARTLTSLAEHTESDIRACLNTLQFLKRKGQPLTNVDVASQMSGSKDMTKSVFQIWAEAFRKVATPSRLLMPQTTGGTYNCGKEQLKFVGLYDMISNFGDYELVLSGIHENLLRIGYQDSTLLKTVESLDWMCESDVRSHQVLSKQRFFLNAYQPSTLLTIRNLVATPIKPNIEWPRALQRYRTDVTLKRELLSTWLAKMSPAVSRGLSINNLTMDLLSPLLSILSPPLRSVAAQLYTKAEKETMRQLVDSMICCGLTYKQDLGVREPGSDWQTPGEVRLDPPIKSLISFEGHRVQHRQLSTTFSQLLGHEIELERIRRESIALVKPDQDPVQKPSSVGMTKHRNEARKGSLACSNMFKKEHERQVVKQQPTLAAVKGNSSGTSSAAKDEAPAILVKPKRVQTSGSFFDQWKKKSSQSENGKSPSANLSSKRDARPLLYKFHEGFTNAIRRPMLVREFL